MTAQRPLGFFPSAIEPMPCASSSRARPAPVLLWALRRMAPPAQLRADWADTSGPRRRRIRQDLGLGAAGCRAACPAQVRTLPAILLSPIAAPTPRVRQHNEGAMALCCNGSCILHRSARILPLIAQWLRHPPAKRERSARRCAVTHCAERSRPQVGGAVLGRIPAVHIRAAAAGGAALTALSQRFLLMWINGWTPHAAPGLGSPAATSAPGLGSPAATSAPRLGPQKMASVLAASIGPSYHRTDSTAQPIWCGTLAVEQNERRKPGNGLCSELLWVHVPPCAELVPLPSIARAEPSRPSSRAYLILPIHTARARSPLAAPSASRLPSRACVPHTRTRHVVARPAASRAS
jgi:hypothetical protein